MPYYNAGTQSPLAIAVFPGSKTYLLGNTQADGGVFNIVNVAITTNVATVTVTGFSGNLPVVGTLITIRGSQQQTGAFNVTAAPVTAVNLDQTGAGTISFALTGANLATTADTGTLSFLPQVTGEAAVNNAQTIWGALSRPSGARSQQAVFIQGLLPAAGVTALTLTPRLSSDRINWTPATQTITLSNTVTNGLAYFETTALFVSVALTGLAGTGPVAIEINI